MKIVLQSSSAPARYAAEELAKYAFLMGGRMWDILNDDKPDSDAVNLGLLADFGLDDSEVDDAFIEDIIDIKIENGRGYIAGSNPRSILIGVYRYLRSAGCMWVRPGIEGEYIPKYDLAAHSYKYRKKADHPFRGQCSEGAISYESLHDMIVWLPKVGMNMLMNEGRVPYLYMHKWYCHINNTFLREKGMVANYRAMEQYIKLCEIDFMRTGVQYHNMGHGWMFEEFGVENGHNHLANVNMTDEDKQYLALVNGKRDICGNSIFYTNFCYSNPEARRRLVNFWVKYAKEKPYIDYFHVWLGDARGTGCRCDECAKMEFSDWYVMLLNEIDEALTAEGIEARFVFIMYVYTHRPPRQLKINNPNRFMLLYACGIDYHNGYITDDFTGEEPPYSIAQSVVPTQELGNKWRRDWKEISGTKLSCVYEYRYYMDHFTDPGYMDIARETYRDMKLLSALDYQGCMSDQTLRNFLPTGLPMAIMAETLFDTSLDFESYCDEYFSAAFGEYGEECREYLETLTKLFRRELVKNDVTVPSADEAGFTADQLELFKTGWRNNDEAAHSFAQIPAVIEAFLPTIEAGRNSDNICHKRSFDLLKYHAHIASELSKALLCGAQGRLADGGMIFAELTDWISQREFDLAPAFDLFLFRKYYGPKFGLERGEFMDGLGGV